MLASIGFKEFWKGVALPALVAVQFLALLVGGVMVFSTARSDKLAGQRQERLLALAIQQSIAEIQNNQEASTYWDDAVLRLRESPLDMEWLDNNMGVWFHEYYLHDEVYLLDPRNQPIYAMRDGERVSPQMYGAVSGDILPMVGELRRHLQHGFAPRSEGTGQTVSVAANSLLRGRPATISIKPVIPESAEIAQPAGSEYLHISVRFMDGSWAQAQSRDLSIEDLRFSTVPGDGLAHKLENSAGETIGYFNWVPFRPGAQVREMLAPVLIGVLLLVGAVLVFLLLRLARNRLELELSARRMHYLAYHDPLTGLPNRTQFDERFRDALATSANLPVALILLDLDRFKNVNDTLGHLAGDGLIREFGARLTGLLRGNDLVARLGGDEFAVVLHNTTNEQAVTICERLQERVRLPFQVVGGEAYVGVSAGIALSSPVMADAAELTRRADIALYRAKADGKATHRIFHGEMDDAVRQRREIEVCLRQALANRDGLYLLYQPELCGLTGSILGVEALLRWAHPFLGNVSTEVLIDVAEETGLITELGEWVLEEACRQSLNWPDLFVAVNLSPVQFHALSMADRICQIVARTGANPAKVQLEVTERLLLANTDGLRATLKQLQDAGFSIVLDDFGTGYSSLSYLQLYPFDKIKIDKSFVQSIGQADDASSIVIAMLSLAAALKLVVTAEGVETEAQRQFLKAAGCAEMQGYLFYSPLTANRLDEVLATQQAGKLSPIMRRA